MSPTRSVFLVFTRYWKNFTRTCLSKVLTNTPSGVTPQGDEQEDYWHLTQSKPVTPTLPNNCLAENHAERGRD
jgi:hypothetical protein